MTFIIQTATASMPSHVRGAYKRIAVLEVDDGLVKVSSISQHAKGLVRIVKVWDRVHAGSSQGPNTNYGRAMNAATAMRDALASTSTQA